MKIRLHYELQQANYSLIRTYTLLAWFFDENCLKTLLIAVVSVTAHSWIEWYEIIIRISFICSISAMETSRLWNIFHKFICYILILVFRRSRFKVDNSSHTYRWYSTLALYIMYSFLLESQILYPFTLFLNEGCYYMLLILW